MNKEEYEMQMGIMEANKYNPEFLLKKENSRILFEVINEAKNFKKLQSQLETSNNKLKELSLKIKFEIKKHDLKCIREPFEELLSIIDGNTNE